MLCFFLHLRIFDDHKDYDEDCRHFPDRVLQRGVVTLDELKLLASFRHRPRIRAGRPGRCRGPGVRVDRLCFQSADAQGILRPRVVAKTFRHLCVESHADHATARAGRVQFLNRSLPVAGRPAGTGCIRSLAFFVAFNWEVSRKIRAPEEEIDDLDSYTKLCGTYGAAYLVLAIRVVDTGLVTIVAHHLHFSVWFYAWLLILFLLCMVGFFQYRFRTSPVTVRRMATYAGFYIVAFDLALAVELVRAYGVTVGGIE